MLEVGVRRVEHHAHERDCLERRAQARHVVAETANIEGRREDGAADIDAAFNVGMIVRIQRGHELDGRFLLKPGDHLGPFVEKDVDGSVVEKIAGFVFQERFERLRACRRCLELWRAGLPGIQSTPPEKAVVPPKTGSFSTTMTSRPDFFATIAVESPPAPEPTTSTSQVKRLLSLRQTFHVQSSVPVLNPGRGTISINMPSSPPSTSNSAPLT